MLLSSLLPASVTGPLAALRPVQAAPASAPIVVNEGGDSASCSSTITLRCAIIAANLAPGTSIRFAPGLQAVLLQSALPVITGAWIDGHDTVTPTNGCVCPRIDGAFWSGPTGNALTINASFVTISASCRPRPSVRPSPQPSASAWPATT